MSFQITEAVPAREHCFFYDGLDETSRADEKCLRWLVFTQTEAVYESSLLKRDPQKIVNVHIDGSSLLRLDASHGKGYYIWLANYNNNVGRASRSPVAKKVFDDGLFWTVLVSTRQLPCGTKFTVQKSDNIRRVRVEFEDRLGRRIWHVRYVDSKRRPPGLRWFKRNVKIPTRYLSCYDGVFIPHRTVPHRDVISVLEIESDFEEAFFEHATPGICYWTNLIGFREFALARGLKPSIEEKEEKSSVHYDTKFLLTSLVYGKRLACFAGLAVEELTSKNYGVSSSPNIAIVKFGLTCRICLDDIKVGRPFLFFDLRDLCLHLANIEIHKNKTVNCDNFFNYLFEV